MVAMTSIHEWTGEPGVLITWNPSPASRAKAQQAPVSDVPVSYQQAQHMAAFLAHRAGGTDMARLNVPAWDIPGRCDIRTMTHVINNYLRRHDTYHSWFEHVGGDEFVRHTITNPRDIKFVPTEHGMVTAEQWRDHVLATPGPLTWDCFHFGIIQREDHFTIYISVDHVHTDAMFMAQAFGEIHLMYQALVSGAPPLPLPQAGSYNDYCRRQRAYTDSLTVTSQEVRDWIEFARSNGGTLPRFPLPLGDPSEPYTGELLTVQLMDAEQTDRFERACLEAGARISGGVMAAAAFAEYELTGSQTYNTVTPTTTRRTPEEFMTTGWFTGVVPISISVVPSSFGQTALAAQKAFDGGMDLAHVPFERVVELAGELGVHKGGPGAQMLSFLDAGLPPLSADIIGRWKALNGRIFTDSRAAFQVGMWVNRMQETTVTVAFPSNPIARESVQRYVELMRAVFLRFAEGGDEAVAAGLGAGVGLKSA
ncbi:condensation domain-containing protein [uncultured Mycolicibacterium sp.]|uniref:condensation domain-containing protein n=1 Tax=uncultured Mycolicibacterium sp. TaxID=2320817 RepID=UPI002630AFEB|nr:condensation domain-containing protein [uncultured Mycolicibacterium sp.]